MSVRGYAWAAARPIIAPMRIVDFEIVEHLVLKVVFEDGTPLEVRFSAARLRGVSAALQLSDEFSTARLAGSTVRWRCGFELDGQLARIRVDESSVWSPECR